MVNIRKSKEKENGRNVRTNTTDPTNLVLFCMFLLSGIFLSLFLSSTFGWFADMASYIRKGPPIHVTMPKIGLGTYMLSKESIKSTILKALEIGYRRIDCAPVYFNEDAIGDVLHEQRIVPREELFIVSKLPCPYHKQQHVEKAVLKTLSDLRIDYLDLYLIHWPVAFKYVPIYPKQRGYTNEDIDDSNGGKNIDTSVSLLETWKAMEDLVRKGLVKYIGLSNVPVALLNELLANELRVQPAVNQVEMHPYLPQNNLIEFCLQRGIQVQAYSPLGSPGYKGNDEPMLLNDLQDIATSGTPAQVAIAWALQRETTVVVKGTSEAHLQENIKAANVKLKDSEIIKIDSLKRNYRFFRPEGKSIQKESKIFC
jgi:alcohol dehydrogenase (NADP+)